MIDVISHHFGGGAYVKLLTIKEDCCVPQHKHNFDHLSALFSGCVMCDIEGEEPKIYYSPDVILVKANIVHKFTAINGDAVIGCIHATDCTDPDLIDETLINE